MSSPAVRDYRLIDADTHVNEPPDLWVSRVPKKFKERAPRIERFDQGDAWVLEGVEDPINFGLNATAGMDPEKMQGWVRFEDIRAGGYDPKVRLEEMDKDRVDAAVLFPTPRLSHAVIANQDPEFHLACVRAYNDWLHEYASHDPSRLGAIPLLPNRGVDMAVAELERVAERETTKGVLVGCWPHGDLDWSDDDDGVWKTATAADLAVHLHVSLVNEMPTAHKSKIVGDVRWYDAPKRILQLLWSGVFDRVPDLRVAMVELDMGWVPYFKEQVDDRFQRLGQGAGVSLNALPSEYIEQHFWWTYIIDSYGLRNRHDVGVDRIMWSTDYPHVAADYPYSWRRIMTDFSGVLREERDKILVDNAQSLYGFGR